MVANELIQVWNERQVKTIMQDITVKSFGKIHVDAGPEKMLNLLNKVIDSLPSAQSELFDADSCLEGFLSWNEYWKNYASKNDHKEPIQIIHVAYENWIKESKMKEKNSNFQELWENLMIRSTSEAVCETVGSIMNQHAGRNRHLQPLYFSMEIVLHYNLGPLHLLDNLVEETFNREKKTYIRKGKDPNKTSTKNLFKSPAVDTYQNKPERVFGLQVRCRELEFFEILF